LGEKSLNRPKIEGRKGLKTSKGASLKDLIVLEKERGGGQTLSNQGTIGEGKARTKRGKGGRKFGGRGKRVNGGSMR